MTSQLNIINFSLSDHVAHNQSITNIVTEIYDTTHLQTILATTLEFMKQQGLSGIDFPYFDDLDNDIWAFKPKELDVYLTDLSEAKTLNLASRGKDYATNILSYPSEIPAMVLQEMSTLPLGELIICHEVVVKQAEEQNKPVSAHTTHLLVHGVLHLLGFDHELGEQQADEMEGFEIAILEQLSVANPYEQE